MIAAVIAAGLVMWAIIIGAFALWLAGEAILAVANSISYHRWCYACAIRQGRVKSLRWSRLPWSLVKQTGELFGHRKGRTRYFNNAEGSEWCGIGDWTAGGAP